MHRVHTLITNQKMNSQATIIITITSQILIIKVQTKKITLELGIKSQLKNDNYENVSIFFILFQFGNFQISSSFSSLMHFHEDIL